MKKWFLSSTGSGDLSLTIKGFLTSLIPLVVMSAGLMGFQIASEDLEQVVVAVTGIASGVMILVGFARKLYFYFYPPQETVTIDSLPDDEIKMD